MQVFIRTSSLLAGLWLLGLSLASGNAWAQNEPNTVTSFSDKVASMIQLIDYQLPRYNLIEKKISDTYVEMNKLSELLMYPANIPIYRDTALKTCVAMRKAADDARQKVMELNLEWYKKQYDLMAVYTRYGEMLAINVKDAELTKFLARYRELLDKVGVVLKKIQDVYNETDFLLNSKLN